MSVSSANGPEEHAEEGTELGAIRIHQNVIGVIARIAATRVPGVAALAGGLVDGLAGMISGKGGERGVRVSLQEDGVHVEVAAVLKYGVRIPQVAWQVQSDIRQAVEEMTGKNVVAVDVIIQGVEMPHDDKRKTEVTPAAPPAEATMP
jgi:uncharacterized alkaline shock family protein YloU